jgi:small redox-active disulfide protein 2
MPHYAKPAFGARRNRRRLSYTERRADLKMKVLGTGCQKCRSLYAEAEKAIASSGAKVDLEKVEKIEEILKYGVVATPSLVINEEVKASGRIPRCDEILAWITAAAKNTESLP